MPVIPDTGEVRAGMNLGALGAAEKATPGVAEAAAKATEVRNNAVGETAEKTFVGWFDKLTVRPHIDKNVEVGDRRNRADTAEEVSRKIAGRKAIDILADTTPEGIAQQQMLKRGVREALDKVRGGAELKALIDTDALLLDRTLVVLDQHGDVSRAVQAARRDIISEQPDRTKPAEYVAAEAEVTAKKAAQEANDAAIVKNTADQKTVKKAIESFTTAGGEKSVALKKAKDELDVLVEGFPGAKKGDAKALREVFDNRDTLDTRIASYNNYIKDMDAKKPPIVPSSPEGTALKEAKDQRTKLLADGVLIANYGAQYDAKKAPEIALENEKIALEGQDKTLKTNAEELKDDKKVLTAQMIEAQAKLDKAKENFEEPYVKAWEDVVAKAMEKVYSANMGRQEAQRAEIMEELIAKETDPAAKAVYELVDKGRWAEVNKVKLAGLRGTFNRNAKFIGDKEIVKFHDDMIKKDLDSFLNKGQQAFMTPLINDYLSRDPEINAISADPANPDRIAAIKVKAEELYKSEKFQNEVVPKVTKDLLSRAVERGLLKQKDIARIEATEEGKKLMESVTHANAALIEQQKKASGFFGSTAEFLQKNPKLKWWLILTLFFPVPGAMMLAGYAGIRTFQEAKKELRPSGHAKEEHSKEKHEETVHAAPPHAEPVPA